MNEVLNENELKAMQQKCIELINTNDDANILLAIECAKGQGFKPKDILPKPVKKYQEKTQQNTWQHFWGQYNSTHLKDMYEKGYELIFNHPHIAILPKEERIHEATSTKDEENLDYLLSLNLTGNYYDDLPKLQGWALMAQNLMLLKDKKYGGFDFYEPLSIFSSSKEDIYLNEYTGKYEDNASTLLIDKDDNTPLHWEVYEESMMYGINAITWAALYHYLPNYHTVLKDVTKEAIEKGHSNITTFIYNEEGNHYEWLSSAYLTTLQDEFINYPNIRILAKDWDWEQNEEHFKIACQMIKGS